jgi:hypothetical protein
LSEIPKAGKPLKTLFLKPPSFEKFDRGASSRWPATREIESYWYPVWLTYSIMREVAFTSIREFYPDIAAHYIRKHREKAARLAARDAASVP